MFFAGCVSGYLGGELETVLRRWGHGLRVAISTLVSEELHKPTEWDTMPMLDAIETRFADNLSRVENLVSVYERSRGEGSGRRAVHATDVLRSAVVLLHATLEDLVRSIIAWRWPTEAGPEVLDRIPLTGSDTDQPRKFLLGVLASHRGRTVQELISSSVEEYLSRSNYNRPEHVMAALTTVGVEVDQLTSDLDDLRQMMDRRHWIVHRADANPRTGSGQHRAQSISPERIRVWAQNVHVLGQEAVAQLRDN